MTKHGFKNLTDGEIEFFRATKTGYGAKLSAFSEEERQVRPEIIRYLCENSGDRDIVAAFGVALEGAIVSGVIDLNNLEIEVPLFLVNCKIGRLNIRAKAKSIYLNYSIFEDGINAQGIKAEGWFMRGAKVEGQLNLAGAVLEGQFNANAAEFKAGENGRAIFAQGVKARDWFMNGAKIEGELNLVGAVLEGMFVAKDARFKAAEDGLAIFAQGVKARDWFMHGAKVEGLLNLVGAVLEGHFYANDAKFKAGEGGMAIFAQGVKATAWLMREKCKVNGEIYLYSSEIGYVDFSDSIITSNTTGMAIILNSAICETINTDSGFASCGIIIIDGAKINGRLNLSKASLFSHDYLYPNEKVIEKLREFKKIAFSAVDAEIGRLELPEQIDVDDKPMVRGIINLSRAKIGALVDVQSGWYPEHKKQLPPWLRTGDEAVHDEKGMMHIVLDGTQYEFLENPGGVRLNNDGNDLPCETIWQCRVKWLRSQNTDTLIAKFNPQPWRQLARTLTAMGFEEDARHIAVQRRVAQRVTESWFHRSTSWLLHKLANYGFSPWLTIMWCLGFIAVFGTLYGFASGCWVSCNAGDKLQFGTFFATIPGDVLLANEQAIYPSFNPWYYSLDNFIPILDLGTDKFWRPHSGLWYFISVFEQIVGATMVALAITGFTGLLTRDEAI